MIACEKHIARRKEARPEGLSPESFGHLTPSDNAEYNMAHVMDNLEKRAFLGLKAASRSNHGLPFMLQSR
jgi:hypothetical protein